MIQQFRKMHLLYRANHGKETYFISETYFFEKRYLTI
jgi:hypothetical protein